VAIGSCSPERGLLFQDVRHQLRNGFRGQFGRPQNAVVGSDAWLFTPLPPVERRAGAVFVVTPQTRV
jgi:hypothetical protein